MEQKKMKQATSGNVIKFVKAGDSVAGVLIGYEESRTYPNSYAVKVKNPAQDQAVVVFVSGVVIDLIKTNNINIGQDIMIEYCGKKKSEKSGMEYNDYKVYYG